MKLQSILRPLKKFSKGMFTILTINLFVVLCVFIFDSCTKVAYEKSNAKTAKSKFISALETNKKNIASVAFGSQLNTSFKTNAQIEGQTAEELTVYVQFPDEVNSEARSLFQNTNSVQGLVNLIHGADAIIQYEPTATNTEYQINVPIETIITALNPLVQESKQYLYSKGFTEQDIQQMIAEEGAEETDLIPFVMALTQVENSPEVAKNYLDFFVNSANAREITWSDAGACAVAALLGDFAGFAYGSSATVWSISAMKTAFKSIAKKALGPVGVAIAVAEFGICLTGVYLS